MPQFILEEKDDQVYDFEKFELTLSNAGHYVLSDSGYFEFTTLDDFKPIKNGFRVINEDGDFEDISEEHFKEIEKLYIAYQNEEPTIIDEN